MPVKNINPSQFLKICRFTNIKTKSLSIIIVFNQIGTIPKFYSPKKNENYQIYIKLPVTLDKLTFYASVGLNQLIHRFLDAKCVCLHLKSDARTRACKKIHFLLLKLFEFWIASVELIQIIMLVKEVDACSFDNWFRIFEKLTFRSIVLTIPSDVLAYLRSDESLVNMTYFYLWNTGLIMRFSKSVLQFWVAPPHPPHP